MFCQLFDDYMSLAATQRVDDSAELKSKSRRQRLDLLVKATSCLEKAIDLENSTNITDEVSILLGITAGSDRYWIYSFAVTRIVLPVPHYDLALSRRLLPEKHIWTK